MTNFKGTKGNWILRQFPEGQMSVRTMDDYREICVSRLNNYEELKANLLLISKAPEMLEMLEELSVVLVRFPEIHKMVNKLIKEATEL
jgi:hypothetical protein